MNPQQIETSIDKIPSALNDIFKGLEGSYVKSSNSNRIVLTGREHLAAAQNWVAALAAAIPGRFFIVNFDPADKDLRVSLAARCSALCRGQSVCSEVITLSCGAQQLAAVPSVIRSHLLTGRRAEVVMFPGLAGTASFADLTHLAEFLVIDSKYFWNDRGFLLKCVKDFERVIDLQWLKVAPWREVLRNAFELQEVAAAFTDLRRVEVTSPTVGSQLPVHLLLGWLCQCLNIHPVAYNSSTFECHTRTGNAIAIKTTYKKVEAPASRGICSLAFESQTETVSKLSFELQADLRVQVIFNGRVVLIEKFDPVDDMDLLSKYFAVGESTVSYTDSLVKALELAQLEQGFL